MKIDLRTHDLIRVEPGTIVITSKGFEFIRLEGDEEAWRDLTTGLKWLDREPKIYTYEQAMKKFNSSDKRLPTLEEFKEAENHGFREVLPNMNHEYLSASLYPDDCDSVRLIDGSNGFICDGYLYEAHYVRLVGR